jgi:hypothetical protein
MLTILAAQAVLVAEELLDIQVTAGLALMGRREIPLAQAVEV